MKKLLALSLAVAGIIMFSGCVNPQPKVIEEEAIIEDSIEVSAPDSIIISVPDSLAVVEEEIEVIEE